MTSHFTVDGIEPLVRRPSLKLGSAAHRGEVGTGDLLVDDAEATLAFPALKIARLTEDASGLTKHLYRGRSMIKGYSRGGFVVGNSRQYRITFSDSNWDLRRLRVHQWARPSETGRARVVALGAYILNGSSSTVTNARKRPSTVIDVATYVPNTNTVTMPARTYDSTDPVSVIDDCARAEGKQYFVIVDDAGSMFLWYDIPTSTSYASTLAISDTTWDRVTVFPPIDDGLPSEEDGSELLSGAGLVDSTGTAYAQQDVAIETGHDVAEDTIYDDGAGSVDATNRLTAFLDERKEEELRRACAVRLPAEQAHLIKAGMTISFRWAAAGVTSPVTLRVARCTPEQMDDPLLYLLHLELGFPEKIAARIGDHGRGVIQAAAVIAATEADATFSLGSDIPLDQNQLYETDSVFGAWFGVPNAQGISGVDVINTVAGGCSGTLDLWHTPRVYYFAFRTTGVLPANSSYLGLELEFRLENDTHSRGVKGGAGGYESPIKGPHLLTAGFVGNTLLVGDVAGGVPVAVLWGNATTTPQLKILIPSNLCPWGSGTRFVIQPQFRMTFTIGCEGQFGGASGEGSTKPRDNVSLKPITIATAGWLTGGIVGTQDGINTAFTLVGGWGDVESVAVNGLGFPMDDVDLSGGTPNIVFKGWAPRATDAVMVRYRSL